MKIIKASVLATTLFTLLSSTSIPAAMSKPAGSVPSAVDKSKQPRIPSSILVTDGNPNGAQVRILFKLRGDDIKKSAYISIGRTYVNANSN
jgi:uncharacterized protein YegL